VPKINLTDADIIVAVAPEVNIPSVPSGLRIRLPKGYPAVLLNSLRYKDLLQDIVLAQSDPAKLEAKYREILTPAQFEELKEGLGRVRVPVTARDGPSTLDITVTEREFIQSYYSNSLTRIENLGHHFGADLPDRDKQALIAFLATL
jgi:hypothetical protein